MLPRYPVEGVLLTSRMLSGRTPTYAPSRDNCAA